jgi:DNA gyrase/topoisomerase IV subunit B
MSAKENKREFKVLDDREHVLCRPGMYLGQTALTEKEMWLYNEKDNKFSFGKIKFVPALLKYISELLDNSIDVAIDTNFTKANKIQVNIDEKSVEVIDNGIGIPCRPPDGSSDTSPNGTCVVAAWTKLKSGTSFGDSRNKIGTNGVGASCSNIFSKIFIGHSDDGKKQQTVECRDNMSIIKAKPVKSSSGKSGVSVYCEPDLARFNLEKITDEHINLVYQRLVTLSIAYPNIKFYFNQKQVKVNEKKFAEMFSDKYVLASTSNTTIIAFPNEYDEFKSFSQVNGIDTFRGGEHVNYIAYEITSRVRDKLIKKYKTIRPGDVKNKLCLAVILTGFNNPEFDAQTKESLSNPSGDIGRHIGGQIDFDAFAKKVSKEDAIIGPIIETFKIKEELKARQELKAVKKVKVKSDKYMSPIGSQCNLFLCEGHSASSSLCSCLGREGNGFYALRGLPINTLDNSIQKIAANQEFKDVMNLLGLDITKDSNTQNIQFERVVIATDQDLDGIHLSSMLIGWFKKFAPNLFNEGRICKLQTPLVIIKDSKDQIKEYFFDLDAFKEWEKQNMGTKLKIQYQKGLGSVERSDMKWLMDKNGGVNGFLYELNANDDGFAEVDLWLTGDAEPRKEKLRQYTLDINMV